MAVMAHQPSQQHVAPDQLHSHGEWSITRVAFPSNSKLLARDTTMSLTQTYRSCQTRITLRNDGSLCNWHLFSIHLAVGLRWRAVVSRSAAAGAAPCWYRSSCSCTSPPACSSTWRTWSTTTSPCCDAALPWDVATRPVDHVEDGESAPLFQKARWVQYAAYSAYSVPPATAPRVLHMETWDNVLCAVSGLLQLLIPSNFVSVSIEISCIVQLCAQCIEYVEHLFQIIKPNVLLCTGRV